MQTVYMLQIHTYDETKRHWTHMHISFCSSFFYTHVCTHINLLSSCLSLSYTHTHTHTHPLSCKELHVTLTKTVTAEPKCSIRTI